MRTTSRQLAAAVAGRRRSPRTRDRDEDLAAAEERAARPAPASSGS